jgi:MoxR-like ATPase
MPDAFLRRCFFHYIRFPDKDTLTQIVLAHFPTLQADLLTAALEVFFDLRAVDALKKKPSTSELLDWLKLLLAEQIAPSVLQDKQHQGGLMPLYGALLKNEQDVALLEKLAFMARRAGR